MHGYGWAQGISNTIALPNKSPCCIPQLGVLIKGLHLVFSAVVVSATWMKEGQGSGECTGQDDAQGCHVEAERRG